MSIVSLVDYTPIQRFDGTPWHHALIQESASSDGPWTTIATINFDPVDLDPVHPATRSFTVNGTLDEGWYRVVFVDQPGNQMLPTTPIHNIPDVEFSILPTLADVGALLRTRTVSTTGAELGTFTTSTHPTSDEALALIYQAARDVSVQLGEHIPDKFLPDAKELVKYRAAMLIELSFYAEQVATQRSPYAQYKDLYVTALPMLVKAISDVEGDDSDVEGTGAGMPHFSFPVNKGGMVGFRTPM